jgi:hypothetical protein
MNKNSTVFLAFFTFIFFLYSFVPGFDTSLFGMFKGEETPYLFFTFSIGAIIIAILLVNRTIQRWMAIRLVSNEKKFIWISPISKVYLSRIRLYLVLENLYFPFFAAYFLWVHPVTGLLGWVFVAGIVETLLFFCLNANARKMKCGITSQALILCDREAKVYYFSGLRKISLIQQAIYFEYKEELTLLFPNDAIEKNQQTAFTQKLIQQINTDKVFVSETIKNNGNSF